MTVDNTKLGYLDCSSLACKFPVASTVLVDCSSYSNAGIWKNWKWKTWKLEMETGNWKWKLETESGNWKLEIQSYTVNTQN